MTMLSSVTNSVDSLMPVAEATKWRRQCGFHVFNGLRQAVCFSCFASSMNCLSLKASAAFGMAAFEIGTNSNSLIPAYTTTMPSSHAVFGFWRRIDHSQTVKSHSGKVLNGFHWVIPV